MQIHCQFIEWLGREKAHMSHFIRQWVLGVYELVGDRVFCVMENELYSIDNQSIVLNLQVLKPPFQGNVRFDL